MKLSQLRNFTAVVKAGAVRQAAKLLNLSQSSVTKSIQQLEDDLGVALLHRGAHGVAPTEAGKALFARTKTIEAELGCATPATTSKRSRAPASAKSASAPRRRSPPACCRDPSSPSSARIRA